MKNKRVIGIAIVFSLFLGLALIAHSQEPDFGSLPPPPAFPGAAAPASPPPASEPDFGQLPAPPSFPGAAEERAPPPSGPDFGQLPPPPAFPGAAAPVSSPPVARSLPGDISGPNGVADGRCVNLYDIWAMGPQVGVCQLPAGSPLDTNGDGCFTEPDVRVIMQSVNVRCS